MMPLPPIPFEELRDRICSRMHEEDRGYKTPCWISDRARGGKGAYTKIGFTVGGINSVWYTHRLAYVVFVGPIPDDKEIDHCCNQGLCCNPDHLAVVTRRENLLRSTGRASLQKAQRACIWGHEFTTTNTYVDKRGRRHCRVCRDRRGEERRRRVARSGATQR